MEDLRLADLPFEEAVRVWMELTGASEVEARFAVSVEQGLLPGDVLEVEETEKHLPGMHDQSSHGQRGGILPIAPMEIPTLYLRNSDDYQIAQQNWEDAGGVGDLLSIVQKAYNVDDPKTGMGARISYLQPEDGGLLLQGQIFRDGRQVGEFARHVGLIDEELSSKPGASHLLLHIFNRTDRQGGFGTRFIANGERVYEQAGIDFITVHAAMSNGGYTWARMGFDFRDPYQLRATIRDYLTPAWGQRYGAQRSFDDLQHSWEIAHLTGPDGFAIGREALIGASWYGVKYLRPDFPGYLVGQDYFAEKGVTTKAMSNNMPTAPQEESLRPMQPLTTPRDQWVEDSCEDLDSAEDQEFDARWRAALEKRFPHLGAGK